MTRKPGPNDPCPCGSGKKRKKCCGKDGRSPGAGKRRTPPYLWIAVAALLLGGVWFGIRMTGESRAPAAPVQPWPGTAPQRAGEPWEYDAASDSHWDPGHGHWHKGRPPADPDAQNSGGTQQSPAGGTPAPWEYDPAKNQHWDPNHGHWHDGRPPTGN